MLEVPGVYNHIRCSYSQHPVYVQNLLWIVTVAANTESQLCKGNRCLLYVCTMLLAAVKFVVSAEVEAFSSLMCC